ncbi:MAG: rhodanese-like domain-containing protein [Bacteroidota bacterium]
MLDFLKNILGSGPKVDIGEWIQNGAVIIDVRTPREFKGGHVKGSQNIPLNEIGGKIEKIKKMNKAVITCCASGARSGSAASKLRAAGIEAVNGGPWHKVEQYL